MIQVKPFISNAPGTCHALLVLEDSGKYQPIITKQALIPLSVLLCLIGRCGI